MYWSLSLSKLFRTFIWNSTSWAAGWAAIGAFNVNFNLPKDAIECANFSLNEGHKFYIQKFNIKPFGAHYYNKKNFKFLNELFLENKIVSKEEIANLNY